MSHLKEDKIYIKENYTHKQKQQMFEWLGKHIASEEIKIKKALNKKKSN